jgi:hypothetical protein
VSLSCFTLVLAAIALVAIALVAIALVDIALVDIALVGIALVDIALVAQQGTGCEDADILERLLYCSPGSNFCHRLRT